MPVKKLNGQRKKDGLQPYLVRVNYTDIHGNYKCKKKTVYGLEQAKEAEARLKIQVKDTDTLYSKKLTVKQLYAEYIEAKQYETRLSSLGKTRSILRNHVLNAIPGHYVNKLTTQDLQKWKLDIEEKGLALITRQNIYGEFRAMLNFAVRMEHIPKNPLLKVGNFRGALKIKKE